MTLPDDKLTYLDLLQIVIISWELVQISFYFIMPFEIAQWLLTTTWIEIPAFWGIICFAKWVNTPKRRP